MGLSDSSYYLWLKHANRNALVRLVAQGHTGTVLFGHLPLQVAEYRPWEIMHKGQKSARREELHEKERAEVNDAR